MRAELINIVDNDYIVLKLLSSFAVRSAEKTSEFILIAWFSWCSAGELRTLCRFNYLPRKIIKLCLLDNCPTNMLWESKCQMKADTQLWKSTVTEFWEHLKLMLRPCACAKINKKPLSRHISQFEFSQAFMQVNTQGEICSRFVFLCNYSLLGTAY